MSFLATLGYGIGTTPISPNLGFGATYLGG